MATEHLSTSAVEKDFSPILGFTNIQTARSPGERAREGEKPSTGFVVPSQTKLKVVIAE
jgi:hypothetical protein